MPASDKLQTLRGANNIDLHLAAESEIKELFNSCAAGIVLPFGPALENETFVNDSLANLDKVNFEAGSHEDLIHVKAADPSTLFSGIRHACVNPNTTLRRSHVTLYAFGLA